MAANRCAEIKHAASAGIRRRAPIAGMMMGTIRQGLAVLCGSAAMLAVSPAFAAGAPAPAKAILVSPLSLVNTEDLDFGSIVAGATAGTVTVNENSGVRSTTGGATAAGGTPRRAEFVGVGRPGILTIVSIGASPTLTNGTGGTMATALAVEGGAGLRLLPGSGIQTFRVGGTLSVAANQQQGNYTGTFTMTVIYF